MNMDLSTNPNIPKNIADRIKSRLAKPTNFNLFFDQSKSIYRIEEKLDNIQGRNRGMSMRSASDDANIVHTDLTLKEQVSQQELFGKLFLVSRNHKKRKWNFTGASKQIGSYTAYEATYTHMQTTSQFGMSFWMRNDKNKTVEEPKKEKVTVSVWFTPDIPISAGPASYYGLPGLVLMVQDNNRVIVCKEIKMNVIENIKLDSPKRGQKVNQKEFSNIRIEKTKEMRDRFRSNRNKGNGSRQIR
jgi:GLPGLI family protein